MFEFLNNGIVSGLIMMALSAVIGGLIRIHSKIVDLHEWHNKEDAEGVKVWYSKNKNLEVAMDRMAEILDRMDRRDEVLMLLNKHQTDVLEKHTKVIESLVAVCNTLVIETRAFRDRM